MSGIGRRGFIGTLLGGAIAGPSMAKAAAESMTTSGLIGRAAGIGLASQKRYASQLVGCGPQEGDWAAEQLARLRSLTPEEKRTQFGNYEEDRFNASIIALQSVSDVHKRRMIFEQSIERRYSRSIMDAIVSMARSRA